MPKAIIPRPAKILTALAVVVSHAGHPVLVDHSWVSTSMFIFDPFWPDIEPPLGRQSRDQDFLCNRKKDKRLLKCLEDFYRIKLARMKLLIFQEGFFPNGSAQALRGDRTFFCYCYFNDDTHPAERRLWERGGVLSPPLRICTSTSSSLSNVSFITSPTFPTSRQRVLPCITTFSLSYTFFKLSLSTLTSTFTTNPLFPCNPAL